MLGRHLYLYTKEIGASSVYGYEEEQSDNIYKMSVSDCSLISEMMGGCEVKIDKAY